MQISASSHLGIRSRTTQRTAIRLAKRVAVITTITNVVIFGTLYLIISNQLGAHLQAHVEEVRKTLVGGQNDGSAGFLELAAMVGHIATVAQSDEDIYLLTDGRGAYVAGNVTAMERFEGWRTIPWQDLKLLGEWSPNRTSDAIIGKWTAVKGGHLFVGDGNGDIREAQRLLLIGLLLGIALSIACALVGGYLVGLKTQRRIFEMEQALTAVAAGELGRRVSRSPDADDVDQVAALINSTLERLQRLIANMRQVTVDIAHDLRTPIARMRQKLEVTRSGPESLVAYRRVVDDSIDEIDNVAETFDALLRISELEGGARKSKFVDVDLSSLIANVTDALEASAEERQHELRTNITASPIFVRGDRPLLNQLFVNLIDNAIVHSPSPARIDVELVSEGPSLIARVRDSGPGIPVEERDKVFRRLYRLEKSRTTKGNGLGLSLVAAIAELHEATIALQDNNPGLIVELRFRSASA